MINARKSPRSLFWNSLASPRVSQRNGTVHYLLRHLYFCCTSKQNSNTTKRRWGLILHYLTPTLCSPLKTKPFLLPKTEAVGDVPSPARLQLLVHPFSHCPLPHPQALAMMITMGRAKRDPFCTPLLLCLGVQHDW